MPPSGEVRMMLRTPRTPISKSRPCTGGRAKCQVKPPGAAPRRTISSAKSGWMSKIV